MQPEPVTPASEDFGRRAQSLYDLEVTLQKFLVNLFGSYRLDNPTLNLAQATAATPPIVVDPDNVVSYDPTERAQTLYLKVPPRIVRGRVPRTVTGEIEVDKLPDCPAIIVQAVAAKIELADSHTRTLVTVRILVNAYDENPDSSGYQDVLNMVEAISIALTSFGQAALDQAYPIELPIEWKLVEGDCLPHFIAEMTTQFVLPAGRPMPDSELFGIVPASQIEVRFGADAPQPLPPPYQPPPAPAEPQLIYSWPVENQDDKGFSYGVMGNSTPAMVMGSTYQALLLNQGGKLTSIGLWVRAQSGNFDVIVNVQAATGAAGTVAPTGPILATSDVIKNADLDRTLGSMQEFVFSGANQIDLIAGQTYAFVFTFAGATPPHGESIYLGMNWVQTLPNNVGFDQGGWQTDDFGTLTFYLYALT